MREALAVAVLGAAVLVSSPSSTMAGVKAGPLYGFRLSEWAGSTVEETYAKELSLAGGLGFSGDLAYLGARVSKPLSGNVKIFGDLGWVNVDGFDSGPAINIGGSYRLPIKHKLWFFEAQGSAFKPFIDGLDIHGLSVGGYGIRPVQFSSTLKGSVYGGVGFDYLKIDYGFDDMIGNAFDKSDVNVAALLGLEIEVMPKMLMDVGVTHSDELMLMTTIRTTF